jgi:hypothetical protein
MTRLRIWIAAVGSAWSQLWQTLWVGALFLFGAAPAPDPDETLSAFIGRRAIAGARWARVAELFVDTLMFGIDGLRWHHCRRAAYAHASRAWEARHG